MLLCAIFPREAWKNGTPKKKGTALPKAEKPPTV